MQVHVFYFAVPWKTSFLTKQNLDDIKDNNISTYFTIKKEECTLVELWAEDLGWTAGHSVNITGISRFPFLYVCVDKVKMVQVNNLDLLPIPDLISL